MRPSEHSTPVIADVTSSSSPVFTPASVRGPKALGHLPNAQGRDVSRSERRVCAKGRHRNAQGGSAVAWVAEVEALVCARCGAVVAVD